LERLGPRLVRIPIVAIAHPLAPYPAAQPRTTAPPTPATTSRPPPPQRMARVELLCRASPIIERTPRRRSPTAAADASPDSSNPTAPGRPPADAHALSTTLSRPSSAHAPAPAELANLRRPIGVAPAIQCPHVGVVNYRLHVSAETPASMLSTHLRLSVARAPAPHLPICTSRRSRLRSSALTWGLGTRLRVVRWRRHRR